MNFGQTWIESNLTPVHLKTCFQEFSCAIFKFYDHCGNSAVICLRSKYSWGRHKDMAHASWIESRHLWRESRLHPTTALRFCFSHSNSVHQVISNLKEPVGAEKTKVHNHTKHSLLPSPPASNLFHQFKMKNKRKYACQTEVKNTAEHTPSEENYNYQDQNTTQMLATNLRLC